MAATIAGLTIKVPVPQNNIIGTVRFSGDRFMLSRKVLYLIIISAIVLLTGCRGGSKVITQTENFDFEEMKNSPWAIGGVYLNTNFVPDGAAEKEIKPFLTPWHAISEVFSPMLYGGFMQTEPTMEVWTFGTVFSQVPEEFLKAVADGVANSKAPTRDQIKDIAENLPKVQYLVFARLDDTELVTDQDMASTVVDQRNRDGRDPHANSLARTVIIRRGVYMSMEVYSLTDGTMVWSGKADTWDEDFLNGDANEQSNDVRVLKEGEGSEVTEIQLDGIMRKGPSLFDVADETCVKLVSAIKLSSPEKGHEF